jgi:hypothetical protein
MSQIYNIYCDESCHLENDHLQVMVLGAIWCPLEKVKEIALQLRRIKAFHGMKPDFEVKWTKVSPAKRRFYKDLIECFFSEDNLHFRALIVPDKTKLRHEDFGQSHDDWYFKMYFDMLKVIFEPNAHYRIYLDIKDTRSAAKIAKLHDVLCNSMYDFSCQIIERVQTVRSHEVEIMQLVDLLIGAVAYVNRNLSTSETKLELINLIRERSHYSLTRTTLLREDKFNLFRWHASERES